MELKGITNLLSCFEVYAQIVCFFAHPAVVVPLQEAFASYRCHILCLLVIYTWETLRVFHLVFVYTRITRGQDDAVGWKTIERGLEDQVLLKRLSRTDPRPIAPSNKDKKHRPLGNSCDNFNERICNRPDCKYPYKCSRCGGAHPAKSCSKPPTSSANSVPIKSPR